MSDIDLEKEKLRRAVEVLTTGLKFYSEKGSSEKHSSTFWNGHIFVTCGKFGETNAEIKPHVYAEDALAEAAVFLKEPHA